jgi:hypothetical protein
MTKNVLVIIDFGPVYPIVRLVVVPGSFLTSCVMVTGTKTDWIGVRDCSLTISRADRTRVSADSRDFASEGTLVRAHPVFRLLNRAVFI